MLQDKEIARLQTVVDRFGAKATKAAMAHSKEKQIARLESQRVKVGASDKTLRVRFPDPPSSGVTVIEAKELAKGYGGPRVFDDVSFDLGRGERLLVLGLNGAGKTSLLRILAARRGRMTASSPSDTTSTSGTTRRSTTTCAARTRCSRTSAAQCRRV
jgi:ATPase subunit of ABC transporter with duplicated ATPase domains